MEIPKTLDSLLYWGMGPEENYPDRREGARIGWYGVGQQGFISPYIKPQEFGTRMDIKMLQIVGSTEIGLEVLGESFAASYHPYALKSLSNARHAYEIAPSSSNHLYLDHQIMGVGGDLSWLPSVHDAYLIQDKTFTFNLEFRPILQR